MSLPPLSPEGFLIENRWLGRGPDGGLVSCAIYRNGSGLEVRCGFLDPSFVHAESANDLPAARALADPWLGELMVRGGTQLPHE